MHFAYILKSQKDPTKIYIGITNDLARRLQEHNDVPSCAYTKSYGPWKLEAYVVVRDVEKARNLEGYLKTHAGKAFLRKRLIDAS